MVHANATVGAAAPGGHLHRRWQRRLELVGGVVFGRNLQRDVAQGVRVAAIPLYQPRAGEVDGDRVVSLLLGPQRRGKREAERPGAELPFEPVGNAADDDLGRAAGLHWREDDGALGSAYCILKRRDDVGRPLPVLRDVEGRSPLVVLCPWVGPGVDQGANDSRTRVPHCRKMECTEATLRARVDIGASVDQYGDNFGKFCVVRGHVKRRCV